MKRLAALTKTFRATRIGLEQTPDGIWFHFGYGRGSRRFPTLHELAAEMRPWLASERRSLVTQAAEIDQIERHLTRHLTQGD